MERLSAPTLLLSALTVTFAAIDWVLSLDPHWFSSIFGIYFFSGSMVAFLAALTLIVDVLQRRFGLLPMVQAKHRHDLGKLLFGFNCFWAYIAFSQYLLIWYANIPEETSWFQVRQSGGWGMISLVLVVGHFVLPFLGLMPRRMKENPQILVVWSVVLLMMHATDLYWLIFPTLNPTGPVFSVQPILSLLGVGGVYIAGWLWIAGQHPLLPVGDPRLIESLSGGHRTLKLKQYIEAKLATSAEDQEQSMATYDDVSTQNITVMGICAAVGTFVIIIGLQSMYYRFESQEYQRKVVTAPTVGPDSLLNDQRSRLNAYGWIDRERRLVGIPIDDAMTLTVVRENQQKTRSSDDANSSQRSL
jgi:hypothetical protein